MCTPSVVPVCGLTRPCLRSLSLSLSEGLYKDPNPLSCRSVVLESELLDSSTSASLSPTQLTIIVNMSSVYEDIGSALSQRANADRVEGTFDFSGDPTVYSDRVN